MKIGYFLSSEQFGPAQLLDQARRADEAGFDALWISDHFHPWTDEQGQSPFVWSLVGALAVATPRLPVTTAVTCPIIRIHPVIVAQAAATAAVMHEGRFVLGVGTGENLNEHVWGAPWPPIEERLERLREAVHLMRRLWTEEVVDHQGEFYRAVNARIYTRPDEPPPVYVSGFGPKSLRLATEIGDGFISHDPELVPRFREATGVRKPIQGGMKVCFDADEERAVRDAHRLWGVELLPGQLNQELATPTLFEQALSMTSPRSITEIVPCGPDPDRHIASLRSKADAGFDEVYVQQIGPDLDGFFDLYANTILPAFDRGRAAA